MIQRTSKIKFIESNSMRIINSSTKDTIQFNYNNNLSLAFITLLPLEIYYTLNRTEKLSLICTGKYSKVAANIPSMTANFHNFTPK